MEDNKGKAIVVGAGISGIRSALDLAEGGVSVTLIDRAPHIGGILSLLDRQFPSNRCGMCRMLPMVQRDEAEHFCLRKGLFHENIEILLNTEISDISGEVGRFEVALRSRPTWVDPDLCMGCGACVEVCPVEVPDEFNCGLTSRKAIYLPVPHSIPNPYVIDLAACNRCGACVEVCPADAVDLASERRKAFRILVVDDEEIVRESLKAWLEDDGFSVETAESGDAAIEKLSAQPFHLMLTDIKMPGMDGVVLLEKALEIQPELPVVMMTAYATVETAVDALKIGAVDYLVKPFDPENLNPLVVKVFEDAEAARDKRLTVDSVVFSCGVEYFDPGSGNNTYGYGACPHVVTNLEFERMMSGTGPGGGLPVRPSDGKPLKKIAWFQCVGSRDIQNNADFCSSICCMISIKEAMMAKEKGGGDLDAAIFYMDMRANGKSFERYRQRAENELGVRFVRSRIHSVTTEDATGDPTVRYVTSDGGSMTETFDLVVLAVGQRPASSTAALAEMAGIQVNPTGFAEEDPLAPSQTAVPGIFTSGSFAGLKDIAGSVISASSAALGASLAVGRGDGRVTTAPDDKSGFRDVSAEVPSLLVAICICADRTAEWPEPERKRMAKAMMEDPAVRRVVFIDQFCTRAGWEQLEAEAAEVRPNRIVIGACHPYLFLKRLRQFGRDIGLDPVLMEVAELMAPWKETVPFVRIQSEEEKKAGADADASLVFNRRLAALRMAAARGKYSEPLRFPGTPVVKRALVVGGGIAGMTAALAIADHDVPVDLIEREESLGGNLHWLNRTLEGQSLTPLMEETIKGVENHSGITIRLNTTVAGAYGSAGAFVSTLQDTDGKASVVEHGAVVLAVGGNEAKPDLPVYGQSPAIVTQKELESGMANGTVDFASLGSVVMIQCVGSRQEPRNYCSRVCCPTSLKHALYLKEQNPDLPVYIFYRDMMTCGFSESQFTRARRSGIIFIQYEPENPPEVSVQSGDDPGAGGVTVTAVDPILARTVEINADLLVLATGIVPGLTGILAEAFGAERTQDGFFSEADSKWRPVDAMAPGVFACGIANHPGSVSDSIASARAAAGRCINILSRERLSSGKNTAMVRSSLCSLCLLCLDHCPYQARFVDEESGKMAVRQALCQGCGACAAVCPNGASALSGQTSGQMFEVIDAALTGI